MEIKIKQPRILNPVKYYRISWGKENIRGETFINIKGKTSEEKKNKCKIKYFIFIILSVIEKYNYSK